MGQSFNYSVFATRRSGAALLSWSRTPAYQSSADVLVHSTGPATSSSQLLDMATEKAVAQSGAVTQMAAERCAEGVAAAVVVGTMLLAHVASSSATGDTLPQALRARLRGINHASGAGFEILLLEENATNDWWAMMRPGKRARPNTRIDFPDRSSGSKTNIEAVVVDQNQEGHRRLRDNQTNNRQEYAKISPEVRDEPPDSHSHMAFLCACIASNCANGRDLTWRARMVRNLYTSRP